MAKKIKAIRLSDEAIEVLTKLCAKENRSEGNMIETLLLAAGKRKS